MTIRKLDLSPQADATAQRLADEQGVRVETFLERTIETEMRGQAQRARLFVRRLLSWWAAPIATAVIVLALLEASHGITATYGRDDLFLAMLHWLRVAFVSLFPWPFTILAIITIVLATRTLLGAEEPLIVGAPFAECVQYAHILFAI